MSNSEIEQSGTVKGHLPNEANLSGRISNVVSLSGHISIGSGAGDFIIKMTVEFEGSELIVTSCDTTVEQIDEAVVAEKRVVLVASVDGTILELPMVQGNKGNSYYFCAILSESVLLSSVYKIENTSDWSFGMINIRDITAEDVGYPNSFGEGAPENVGQALDVLITGFNATRKDILRLNKSEHMHTNKPVLDKFSETEGKPTYDGEALGSDFIIRMTIEVNGDNYTVTSCDKTMEQIDAAVASGQNIKAIAFDKFIMPLTQIMENGESYTFGAFLGPFLVMANVSKNPESGADEWQFYSTTLAADIVEYSNDAMPRISTVGEALDKLVLDSHTHSNKSVLDKFAETDGKPTYNGEALVGGAGDFIINMTVEGHDEGYYTVTSCDATIEQIDAAVSAEKRVVLIATDTTIGVFWELPIVEAYPGETYIFIAFTFGRRMMATVYKSGENEIWEFSEGGISAESIDYYNSTQPDVTDVNTALYKLFDNSHTHANKDTLDKLSVLNGKLQYNGSDVGLKPVKGTDYWTAADKAEIVADTLAALPTWTGGNY